MNEKTPVKKRQGFSLVELMVALALSLLVMGFLARLFISQKKNYDDQAVISEMQENVKTGMLMMTTELTSAGYNPAGAAGAGIIQADATVLRVTMDLNGDKDVLDLNPDEDVTFAYNSANKELTRATSGGTGQALAGNIQSMAFAYFDGSGNALTTLPLSSGNRALVRRIKVTITATTAKDASKTRTLSSDVRPRNLGL
ncbi:MAG: hypothetical protein A2521_10570 [Deltaproteobacteria bacterium RIFOXYD12_FULL_57_12]|nr:MAG: hypothetical protein A2521_10570 [Deltaproteobacteria bacterium RIFOXYD12_FULL_57_12]